jgi:hypothetical protein
VLLPAQYATLQARGATPSSSPSQPGLFPSSLAGADGGSFRTGTVLPSFCQPGAAGGQRGWSAAVPRSIPCSTTVPHGIAYVMCPSSSVAGQVWNNRCLLTAMQGRAWLLPLLLCTQLLQAVPSNPKRAG